MGERDRLRQDLLESRAELKTAVAVRDQLQARLRAGSRASPDESLQVQNKTRPPTTRAAPRKRFIPGTSK